MSPGGLDVITRLGHCIAVVASSRVNTLSSGLLFGIRFVVFFLLYFAIFYHDNNYNDLLQ